MYSFTSSNKEEMEFLEVLYSCQTKVKSWLVVGQATGTKSLYFQTCSLYYMSFVPKLNLKRCSIMIHYWRMSTTYVPHDDIEKTFNGFTPCVHCYNSHDEICLFMYTLLKITDLHGWRVMLVCSLYGSLFCLV